MTVADVMLYGKVYQWAVSQMYNEIATRLVPCGCGADVDQPCIFRSGRSGKTPHSDRRCALEQWRKQSTEHQAEYEEFKRELIAYYVSLAVQELKTPPTNALQRI